MKPIKLVALSGSLRKTSYNTALLSAYRNLAPSYIDITLFEELAALPLFNPDIEGDFNAVVARLKTALSGADGLIIASPEYAHGITGVLKNALDWLVSGEEFVNLPVALFNTSPRASHAQAALREVVKTMSGVIIDKACFEVPLLGSQLDAKGIESDAEISSIICHSLSEIYHAISNI